MIGCLLILVPLYLCVQPGESAPEGLWLTASGFFIAGFCFMVLDYLRRIAIAVERLAKKKREGQDDRMKK